MEEASNTNQTSAMLVLPDREDSPPPPILETKEDDIAAEVLPVNTPGLADIVGEIPNVTYESLPGRQIMVHTPTASFQCALRNISSAFQTLGGPSSPLPDTSKHAIAALTQLVSQLVSPMIQQHM